MRWSLILFTFIAAHFALSFAAVIPSSDQLQRRAGPDRGSKVPSSVQRGNARKHPYKYEQDNRKRLKQSDRVPHNDKLLMTPKTDADHVFEHQMLHNHLNKHGLKFDDLHPELKKTLKGIINDPANVAPVSARVNRGKGQVVRHGMKGKNITPNKARDEYIKVSYPTARKTAKKLDQAYRDAGHDFGKHTVQRTLRNMMNNAKLMKPNDPSPASSRSSSRASSKGSSGASSRASSPGLKAGSTKGTPKRAARVHTVGKPSPQKAPARKSVRIAAQKSSKV